MSEKPVIDGRRREALQRHAESIAPYYTEAWDPETDDVGTVMLELFAEMAADVTERLDRVPEKHHVGFFDTLGFRRAAPQSARLPLSFEVSADLDGNVGIPARTRGLAAATDERPEQTFQLPPGSGFEATPATLDRVFSVDPARDMVFDNRGAIGASRETTLFGGENAQRHVLYIGHEDALTVNAGATISVTIETGAPTRVIKDSLLWEYYGVKTVEDESVEGWHEFQGRLESERPHGTRGLDLVLPESGHPTETSVHDVETNWIRCRVPSGVSPTDSFEFRIGSVSVGVTPKEEGSKPDGMRYNDVPLPADGDSITPFGETPQQLNAFYIASSEAFSKKGAAVDVNFERMGKISETETSPRLSWEYWDGNSWTRIPGLDDGTNKLHTGGTVSFVVPTDLEPTGVAGEDGHWIRVRLVGGHYGRLRFEPDEPSGGGDSGGASDGVTWSQVDTVTPPEFTGVTVSFDPERPPLERPTHLLTYNNLAFSENYAETRPERFTPFVALPDGNQTVYLGFEGPLRNGPINLLFALSDVEYPAGFHPRVRWEYCRDPDRNEWARVDAQDETEGLTQRGIAGLVFPEQTTAFERFGRARHWVRARVTGDEFRPEPASTPGAVESLVITEVYPVRELVVVANRAGEPIDLSGYRIDFEYNQPAVQVREFPDGTTIAGGESLVVGTGTKSAGPADLTFDYRRHVLNREDADLIAIQTPDSELVTTQTYREPTVTAVGTGPIVITEVYPVRELVVVANRSDEPIDLSGYRIDFEYNQPAVQVREFPDGTTLPGGQALVLATGARSVGPADLTFDYRRHVINREDADLIAIQTPDGELVAKRSYPERTEKAPIRPGSVLDARQRDKETRGKRGADDDIDHEAAETADVDADEQHVPCPPACFDTLQTVPPTGTPEPTAPLLRGLHPNTGWTVNMRPVEDEMLGSSDGSQNLEFVVSSPPVIESEVWVDELTALSEGQRRALDADDDIDTQAISGRGDLDAFWVRWQRVDDFLTSGGEDRHYTLDPATGTITFGNGVRGAIPPHGRDNVKASYRTGGGSAGNVERGAVTDLVSSIPFVDGVVNPLPGEGGTDAESTDEVLQRAPRELRDRDRAVTEADFERVASAASRDLAKTRCIPGMDEHGDRTPGWVTLLLVPRSGDRQPVPSTAVKERVRDAMEAQAPATLLESDRLVVRGPSYVEVSVEATLVARRGTRISQFEAGTTDALDAFLHPITGGPENGGWAFGTVPCLSDFYALLEGLSGTDYVDDLAVTVTGSEAAVTLTEGQPTPTVAPDTLVFSGVHEITARGGR